MPDLQRLRQLTTTMETLASEVAHHVEDTSEEMARLVTLQGVLDAHRHRFSSIKETLEGLPKKLRQDPATGPDFDALDKLIAALTAAV